VDTYHVPISIRRRRKGHALHERVARREPRGRWLALWAPLSAAGAYVLVIPACLAAAALFVHKVAKSRLAPMLFLLLLASSLAIWEFLIIGSDLLALGALIVVLLLLARVAASLPAVVILTLLTAAAATSRLVFGHLPALVALTVWPINRRNALVVGVGGTVVTGFLHAAFYAWGPGEYGPLQTLGYWDTVAWPPLVGPGFIACAIVAVVMLKVNDVQPGRALLVAWFGLFTPLALGAFGDLAMRGWDLPAWEGMKYVIPSMPFLAAYVGLQAITRGDSSRPTPLSGPAQSGGP
jgi:hypothetical protein